MAVSLDPESFVLRRNLGDALLAQDRLSVPKGDKSLDLIRRLLATAGGNLADGGAILVEIGAGQGPAVGSSVPLRLVVSRWVTQSPRSTSDPGGGVPR